MEGEQEREERTSSRSCFLETATIGSFLALDLLLFFLFFEGLLFPMYLIIGGLGRPAARLRRGEVLHLHDGRVGVPARWASCSCTSAPASVLGHPTFDIRELARCRRRSTTARWLFAAFLVAFAVKVPLVPVHTWLPDAYTEAPPPAR